MLIKSEPELFLVEVDMRSTTASELLPVGYFLKRDYEGEVLNICQIEGFSKLLCT